MQWHTLKKKIAIPWNSLFCERSSNLYKTYNKRSQSLYTLYADSENCKRRIGVTLADDASEGFDSWVHQAVRNGLCKRPDSQKELSIPPFSFSWHFCWRNNSDVWSTSSSFQFALIFGFLNALCCSAISICATELFLQWQSLTDRWIEDVKINISHLHLKHPTMWFKKNKIDMLWGRHLCLVGPVLVCFWRTVIVPRKNTSTWEEYHRKDVLLEIACSLGFLEIATKC